jgi:averantin hydroxylase
MTTKLVELHRKYGDTVRVGPAEISVCGTAGVHDALAHRQGHQEFPKLLKLPALNGTLGILSAHRVEHARFRRVLSNSFSDKSIRTQEKTIQDYANLMVNGLAEHVEEGPQDLVKWFNWTTFDVIGRLTFGASFDCLEKQQTHDWVHAVFQNTKATVIIQILQHLGIDKWVLPLMSNNKAIEARKKNWAYTSNNIDARLEKGTHNGDFWDFVLEKSEEDDGKGMSVEEMKSNAAHLVLAGSETTATLLSGCAYLIASHPEVMKKITTEIRSAFKSLDEINLKSVEHLPYTLAVLNETMRVYPPVSTQLSRVSPPKGEVLEGEYIPGGTVVFISQMAGNLDEANFAHAEEFRPERFLGDSEFKNDKIATLAPFSLGPRNCIGKNLAYAEMRLILAKFLWKFDMDLDPRSKGWVKRQKAYVLWEKDELWMNLKTAS